VAAARVHWGGKLCTYVIDLERHAIYGNMRELSAEEPFVCMYAGRDVSDEVTTSPVEVGSIAFEDDDGAVRAFLCNLNDQARSVTVEFRGVTKRATLEPGELRDLHLVGKPAERQARAAARDVAPRRLETV
jgi:hypothetical protein